MAVVVTFSPLNSLSPRAIFEEDAPVQGAVFRTHAPFSRFARLAGWSLVARFAVLAVLTRRAGGSPGTGLARLSVLAGRAWGSGWAGFARFAVGTAFAGHGVVALGVAAWIASGSVATWFAGRARWAWGTGWSGGTVFAWRAISTCWSDDAVFSRRAGWSRWTGRARFARLWRRRYANFWRRETGKARVTWIARLSGFTWLAWSSRWSGGTRNATTFTACLPLHNGFIMGC